MTDQTGLKLVDLDETGVDRAFRSEDRKSTRLNSSH